MPKEAVAFWPTTTNSWNGGGKTSRSASSSARYPGFTKPEPGRPVVRRSPSPRRIRSDRRRSGRPASGARLGGDCHGTTDPTHGQRWPLHSWSALRPSTTRMSRSPSTAAANAASRAARSRRVCARSKREMPARRPSAPRQSVANRRFEPQAGDPLLEFRRFLGTRRLDRRDQPRLARAAAPATEIQRAEVTWCIRGRGCDGGSTGDSASRRRPAARSRAR